MVVRLDGVTDAEGVLLSTAAAVVLPTGSQQSIADRLAEASVTRPRLVVLDGCEKLAGEPHPVAVLLETCPGYRFVATSPRPLHLEGESVVGLDPLEVPPGWGGRRRLTSYPAVELYCHRAHQAHPLFVPSESDLAAIGELCRRVHGLPLGIELLAARFGFLPTHVVAEQIDLLTGAESVGDEPGAPARHRSVTAAMRWSYDLLDEDTAGMLRLLSVFAAPAPLEMVDGVRDRLPGRVLPPDGRTAVDCVSELVDRRLAEVDLSTAEPGYSLVPLVRSFARERLAGTEGLAVAEDAYRHAVADFVSERGPAVERAAEDRSMQELERSELDLRIVLGSLVAREADPEALRTACSLAPYVLRRGFDGFVGPALSTLVARAADPGPGSPDELLTEAVLRLAHLRLMTEPPEAAAEARAMLATGVLRARQTGSSRLLLLGLAITMQAVPVTGDLAGAVRAATEALRLAEAADDQVWIARFSGWVGMVQNQRGRTDDACRLAERSLTQALACGDPRSLVIAVLLVLGLPARRGAALLRRAPSVEDLLVMVRRCNEPRYEALLLQVGAGHAVSRGDLGLAATRVVEGLGLTRVLPTWASQVCFGGVMVAVAVERGDLVRAARLSALVEPYREQLLLFTPPSWVGLYEAALAATTAALGTEGVAWSPPAQGGGTGAEGLADLLDYARTVAAADRAPSTGKEAVSRAQHSRPELTDRERDVLAELATGATNKQISLRLGLAPKTVNHHATAIYRKLQVRGRAEATAWAFRQGMVT